MTNPYLVRDPPNFLTYDAEELEEFLTDETATAEEPYPDEADELSCVEEYIFSILYFPDLGRVDPLSGSTTSSLVAFDVL